MLLLKVNGRVSSVFARSRLIWSLYKCASFGGLSMVLLQLKNPLELFKKRKGISFLFRKN